jgi:hypothetical protein
MKRMGYLPVVKSHQFHSLIDGALIGRGHFILKNRVLLATDSR